MKQEDKVTDIFEVIKRLPDVNIKYSFISPLVFLCGISPLLVNGNIDRKVLIVLAIITVLCPCLMLTALYEKNQEYRHIKMLTVFESELIVVLAMCFNILLYFVYSNYLINILITIILIALRLFKIHYLERKIKNGKYGYNMNGKMNATFIGLTSYVSARIGMGINNTENPAYRGAAYLGALLLIVEVLLILFAIDPIVAFRIKRREKYKEVKRCQN
jgi:hypothetical protein